MTKDELIDQYAVVIAESLGGVEPQLMPSCRIAAAHNVGQVWPLVTEYMSEWLDKVDEDGELCSAPGLWREENG
jgi:hypothetical protein